MTDEPLDHDTDADTDGEAEAGEKPQAALYRVYWDEGGLGDVDECSIEVRMSGITEHRSLTYVYDEHGLAAAIATDRVLSVVRSDLDDPDEHGGGGGGDDDDPEPEPTGPLLRLVTADELPDDVVALLTPGQAAA